MKARPIDPHCMSLRWGKAIFDKSFHKAEIYPLQSHFEPITFFWKQTLTRITLHTRGQIKAVFYHPNKVVKMGAGIDHVIFSLLLSSKWSSKDKYCDWLKKKSQRIQKSWASHKNNWCDYAQLNKNKENKEKKPKPETGGHEDYFEKTNPKDNRSGNKHKWSLVLKSLKHLLSLQNILFFITNSQSLHYVPNKAHFDQRQAIWIDRQCFNVWVKSLFMQIKWMLGTSSVLNNPQIEI